MLSTEVQRNVAHLYFVQRRSRRDIAGQLKIHRNTVTKYVSAMQSWLDDVDEGSQEDDLMRRLERAIHNDVFTEGKLTETFLKFLERQLELVKAKDRMELFQEISNTEVGAVWQEGEVVHVDCRVGYSTFCKAIKIIEERTGKTLFVKRDTRKRRRGSIWDD